MSGRIVVIAIVVIAALFGATMYYMQVYGYYHDVPAQPGRDVTLVSIASGESQPIAYANFHAIDAESSPIRYRACFTVAMSLTDLTAAYIAPAKAIPLVAPGWFDCFDAEEIGEGLETGTFRAFLSQRNFSYGVDRIVAIAPDGRGWAWHQLNDCGEKSYDGTPLGEDCPPLPTRDGG